ncbi:MAG: 2-hydroxyglutaryl-CoA dehydratase [Chloroflexi bacterium]|nr:2-hydroxyglutaryl-CoA dehydratase [Chloroflexota bacterium]
MYFAGVDIGSTMTKIVVMDGAGNICSRIVGPTGPEHRRLANEVLTQALEQANLSFGQIDYVVATGYGRVNVPFADRQITELTCHARGVASLFPTVRTAIDIGGQDAKGLKIKDGKLLDFVMNDKCAAGTGRFLEVLADTLGLELDDLGGISLESTKKVPISSTCTIFAQQEVIARISEGLPLEDIVAGLHNALAGRVARMVQRLRVEPDVVLTGGVAKNIGVVKAMKENLGYKILVPPDPLLTGAIGAAILGKEITSKAMAEGVPIERKERHLEEVTFFK